MSLNTPFVQQLQALTMQTVAKSSSHFKKWGKSIFTTLLDQSYDIGHDTTVKYKLKELFTGLISNNLDHFRASWVLGTNIVPVLKQDRPSTGEGRAACQKVM